MKTCILFALLLTMTLAVLAQDNQTNHWYLGNNFWTNTATYPPTKELFPADTLYDSNNQEGTSSISDDVGDLLFYTNGQMVFNKNHSVMDNGDSLMGGYSSTQSSLIVPWPEKPGNYFLFTTDDFLHNLQYGLRYSKVSFCESVLGYVDTATKNTLLASPVVEKLCAVHHQNGIDYWVTAHAYGTDEFFLYLVDSGGIHPPVIQSIGTMHSNGIAMSIGMMKFSPDGSHLALAVGNNIPSYVELFCFNTSTGILASPTLLYPDTSNIGNIICNYGVSFSPSGCNLFVSDISGTLWKYAICPYDSASIVNSKVALVSGRDLMHPGGLQLDKHGVIYVACSGTGSIGAIEDPDGTPVYKDSVMVFSPTPTGAQLFLGLSYFVDGFQYPSKQSICLETDISETSTTKAACFPNPFHKEFFLSDNCNEGVLCSMDGRILQTTLDYVSYNKVWVRCSQETSPGWYWFIWKNERGVFMNKVFCN